MTRWVFIPLLILLWTPSHTQGQAPRSTGTIQLKLDDDEKQDVIKVPPENIKSPKANVQPPKPSTLPSPKTENIRANKKDNTEETVPPKATNPPNESASQIAPTKIPSAGKGNTSERQIFSLFGIELGEPENQIKGKIPKLELDTIASRIYENRSYTVHMHSVGKVTFRNLTVGVFNAKVEEISAAFFWPAQSYPALRTVLTDKYGPPKEKKYSIKTRAGVAYTQETCEWLSEEGRLSLHKYGSKIDEGFIFLASKSYLKRKEQKRDSEIEKLKKGL